MALSIKKGPQPRAIRTVIYGPEGIGKSTLASQFPDVVFVDFEHGTDSMDVERFDTPESFDGVLTLLSSVAQEDVCKTVVLDTADKLEQLISRHVCLKYEIRSIEDAGYGKGYTYLAEAWIELMKVCDKVIDSGKNIVFVAHAQMRKFEQPDEMGAYDRWELKLSKKTSPLLKEWSDMLLFCSYKTNVVTDEKTKSKKAVGGKRVMYATHDPCWDAKNRFGLPEVMDMDFEGIAHLFKGPAVAHSTAPEDKEMDWTDGIMKKLPKVKTKTSDPFELAMIVNGLTLEQVQAFSEAKGNFPGINPLEYPKKYKDALMQLDTIERIKIYVKENENG